MYLDSSPPRPDPTPNGFRFEQSRLDIADRSRTSRLPWRGQFSPELIEYLLETICPQASVVFDPFCGSGTVMFEAARRGAVGLGTEVNPAAWHLASLVSLCGPASERQAAHVRGALSELIQGTTRDRDLFFRPGAPIDTLALIEDGGTPPALRTCLAAAVLLGMGDKTGWTPDARMRGLLAAEELLRNIAAYPGSGTCYLSDARSTPLRDASVEAVITSPPYINVFNYHQNYRPAVEMLGWRPLDASRSEIGANRKHRMNRFLTVVQYCLDMAQTLDEIARVCKLDAPVILVIGRESNVLGVAIRNAELLHNLMRCSSAFKIFHSAERVFTNRFGRRIHEDIIVARCVGRARIATDDARSVGEEALNYARSSVPSRNRAALEAARLNAGNVQPSQLLAFSAPVALTVAPQHTTAKFDAG